jgi:pimeloyl-ACP methyl ester carboxylesterase
MLDVLADVRRRFPVDADRVFVSGISAGGAGTFHMAELHPDLFAGAFSLVGYDSTGLPGNLVNTPIRMQNGLADPLVNPALWLPTVQAFDARGDVDYRSFQNANRSHTHVPALGNCIYLDFIRRGRVVDPPRVAYTVKPAYEVDDGTTGLHLHHTGAYWVSGLALRDGGAPGSADVTSLARGDRGRTATAVDAVHNNVVEGGRDYCGANKDVVTGDTWREHSIGVGPGAPQARATAPRRRSPT